jgi:hypothetical protein
MSIIVNCLTDEQLEDPQFVAELIGDGWLAPSGTAQKIVFDAWMRGEGRKLDGTAQSAREALESLEDALSAISRAESEIA